MANSGDFCYLFNSQGYVKIIEEYRNSTQDFRGVKIPFECYYLFLLNHDSACNTRENMPPLSAQTLALISKYINFYSPFFNFIRRFKFIFSCPLNICMLGYNLLNPILAKNKGQDGSTSCTQQMI